MIIKPEPYQCPCCSATGINILEWDEDTQHVIESEPCIDCEGTGISNEPL